MAKRPVFYTALGNVIRKNVEFTWYSGLAVSQKQKSIRALHEAFRNMKPALNPLEISTKSEDAFGKSLSAFNLKLDGVYLENVYQSSKVFENGGPYRDLLQLQPREAKRDERLKSSGNLVTFEYDGKSFGLTPITFFYDYIYIKAVLNSGIDYHKIMEYNGFTDIEYNPLKSISTQAKSAAILRLLLESGIDPEAMLNDPDRFREWHKKAVTC